MLATTTVDANRGVECPNCIGNCVPSDTVLRIDPLVEMGLIGREVSQRCQLWWKVVQNGTEALDDVHFDHEQSIAVLGSLRCTVCAAVATYVKGRVLQRKTGVNDTRRAMTVSLNETSLPDRRHRACLCIDVTCYALILMGDVSSGRALNVRHGLVISAPPCRTTHVGSVALIDGPDSTISTQTRPLSEARLSTWRTWTLTLP